MSSIDQDELREILRERREDQGLTQTELAEKIGSGASQPTLSNVEKGRRDFAGAFPSPQTRLTILREYGFHMDEIRRLNKRFSLELEFVVSPELMRVSSDTPSVRYFGPVNAGLVGVLAAESDLEQVSVPDWISDRYDLTKVFAMDIIGDSMACEDVQHSIPEDSRVYFLEDAPPNTREVVCVRLHDESIHVIKVFRPERGYALLESYNHKHKPILINDDNPGDVVGVYLTHIPRGPRLR